MKSEEICNGCSISTRKHNHDSKSSITLEIVCGTKYSLGKKLLGIFKAVVCLSYLEL